MTWIIYAVLAYLIYKMAFAKKEAPAPKRMKPPEPDPFDQLGVSPDASVVEIRRAYQQRVRGYHPDRVGSAAPELQKLAEKRTKQLNHAYTEALKRKNEPA